MLHHFALIRGPGTWPMHAAPHNETYPETSAIPAWAISIGKLENPYLLYTLFNISGNNFRRIPSNCGLCFSQLQESMDIQLDF